MLTLVSLSNSRCSLRLVYLSFICIGLLSCCIAPPALTQDTPPSVGTKDTKPDPDPPIIEAARNSKPAVLEAMITAGADLNTREKFGGWSPLMVAVMNRGVSNAEVLLKHGADVNAVDNDGNTPLILAVDSLVFNGNAPLGPDPDVVRLLLDHKPDLDHKNKTGRSAMMIALEDYNRTLISLLLAAGASKDGIFDSMLLGCARGRDQEGVQAAVDHKAKLDAVDRHAQTALIIAANGGSLEIVQLLLANKASPNLQDRMGNTALILAARMGRTDVVRALLEAGANLELTRTERGDTALHLGAEQRDVEVVRALLAKGANPNARDKLGETPLHRAARGALINPDNQQLNDFGTRVEVPAIIEELLKHGADPKTGDLDGKTPYDIASAAKQLDLAKILREAMSK